MWRSRALIVEPETLLLDEPLSNLDANLREEMRFELRRLHDTYRYTTIYVTHGQAEAMTTADRIIVMNGGRIEQAGTPEDDYQQPQSEFVARFIGGTNILRGRRLDAEHADILGFTLRCGNGALQDPACAISVRYHDAQRFTTVPPGETENVAPVHVIRQIFLGSARDHFVELASGLTLRVTTPPELFLVPGREAWVYLPPQCCRGLSS